ncbi:transposase [Pseudorhodoplanes sp.]|uniref:transposase n=1 Tax=Pseudorhodoplanes sp. TaxID=1934341 RepID=UPI003D0EFAF3
MRELAPDVQARTGAPTAQVALSAAALKPSLSPLVSPPLSPGAYPSSQLSAPIVQRPREGHRRRFSDADKRWILKEAARPEASSAEVARRYGIDQRLLRRWKQELTETAPSFVTVQITDEAAPLAHTNAEEAVS